jgi:hypothetical protein
MENLAALYEELMIIANRDLLSDAVRECIVKLDTASRDFLRGCERIPLKSRIPGKEYLVFKTDKNFSRPINVKLFDINLPTELSQSYIKDEINKLTKDQAAVTLYTLAMSFCASIDILRKGNKKTPATFFEKFIGNIFAVELQARPIFSLPMLNADILKTDYIFPSSGITTNLHLQIKLSTRERAIEAWAHQRIIDGIFGVDSYRGILVVMSETNAKLSDMSVADVCVPNQWGIYQKYIARLHRIYYLDTPSRTENLHTVAPYIQVKHLSDFFFEKDKVLLANG